MFFIFFLACQVEATQPKQPQSYIDYETYTQPVTKAWLLTTDKDVPAPANKVAARANMHTPIPTLAAFEPRICWSSAVRHARPWLYRCGYHRLSTWNLFGLQSGQRESAPMLK
jgi:hypothetical protein